MIAVLVAEDGRALRSSKENEILIRRSFRWSYVHAFTMDRRRSMIVWLLVFGLIGVLSEPMGDSNAPGQAVRKSARMAKDVGSLEPENIGIDTRKTFVSDKEQLRREREMWKEKEQERNRRERQRELEWEGRLALQRLKERQLAARCKL